MTPSENAGPVAMEMSVKAAELVAALPEDLQRDSEREELKQLIDSLSGRPVPTGRLARLWALGSMQARVAVGYLSAWVRGNFGDADRARQEAHWHAALKLISGMGYMRGAMAKAGQLLASYPAGMPDKVADLLDALNFEAPPMHYSLLREMVRAELGADPDERFDSFETEPFAAASLGQVHGATRDGASLAIKVQYPAIDRTIAADLANLKSFSLPMRLTRDWDNLMEQLEDMERTLLLECDYERELAMGERVRAVLADDPSFVVPRFYPELSGKRVLTMERLDGEPVARWLESDPSQEERNRVGEAILRLTTRLYYVDKLLASDMNPGNFLVMSDGRIGVIDFGAYRAFTDEEWAAITLVLEADTEEKLRHAVTVCASREGVDTPESVMEPMLGICDWFWQPLREDTQPFDFSSAEYLGEGAERWAYLVRHRITRGMPIFQFQSRSFYGVRGMLYRLKACFDARATHHAEMRRAGITPVI